MPLGILTDDEFKSEVDRFNSIPKEIIIGKNIPEIKEIERGRKEGTREVPNEVRKVIAQELIAGASLKSVTEAFGVSTASASAYKNNATSTATYDKPNEELKEANDQFRNKIKTLASDKLLAALESITADKLDNSKVNISSAVARDMSQIIKNVTPENNQVVNNNAVILFKPRMKEEDDYEIIDVQKME